MEIAKTKTIDERPRSSEFKSGGVELNTTEERLNLLIAANAEYDRENLISISEREKFEAALMENPLSVEKAYSYFGLLLGTFPPAAIFMRCIMEVDFLPLWLITSMILVNFTSALTGYLSGKSIGKMVLKLEKYPWANMLFILPFLGFLWGLAVGSSGGLLFFVVGAILGGAIGGLVGSLTLPVFTAFHRLLKRDDKINRRDFVPIALGITFVISAFILTFPL